MIFFYYGNLLLMAYTMFLMGVRVYKKLNTLYLRKIQHFLVDCRTMFCHGKHFGVIIIMCEMYARYVEPTLVYNALQHLSRFHEIEENKLDGLVSTMMESTDANGKAIGMVCMKRNPWNVIQKGAKKNVCRWFDRFWFRIGTYKGLALMSYAMFVVGVRASMIACALKHRVFNIFA